MPHLLITGASGYIGKELIQMTLDRGWGVTALARNCPHWLDQLPVRYVPYDLGKAPEPESLEGVTAVIHLAAVTNDDTQVVDISEDAEVDAAIALLHATQLYGARFVFVSSQSTRSDAPARYGRVKWWIEREVMSAGGIVVRPGLVYGGSRNAGLFGRLCQLVERLPVLPALIPAPRVQPVYIGDLCQALLLLAGEIDSSSGTYNVADPERLSFTQFLNIVACSRLRKRRLFVPMPLFLFTALAMAKRKLSFLPDMGADRIMGLAKLQAMDTQESLQALELELTSIEDGMHPTGSAKRRRFAAEAKVLLSYVLGSPAGPGLMRRYIRAVSSLGEESPLDFPLMVLRFPGLLRYYEAASLAGCSRYGDRLRLRLRMAVMLAEATVEGAERFMVLRPMTWFGAGLRLVGIIISESLVQLLRFILLLKKWSSLHSRVHSSTNEF